jgi:hypothetical protein
MFSMKFNARLDTAHHGPPHPCRDVGIAADSLTGIHNAMVKHPFVVKRSWLHKGFHVSPQAKIQRIQIWQAWRPCSGSSSTCSSAIIDVIENISHSTDKMCRSTIMHVYIRILTASGKSVTGNARNAFEGQPTNRCNRELLPN